LTPSAPIVTRLFSIPEPALAARQRAARQGDFMNAKEALSQTAIAP